jgi:hypothetical protein
MVQYTIDIERGEELKKIIIFLGFILFVFGIYYFKNDPGIEAFYYKDDFDSFNDDFWYAGQWQTLLSAEDKININRGLLSLRIDTVDKGPVLISKPIVLKSGSVMTLKRRVQLKPGDRPFSGGLALIETKDNGRIPSVLNDKDSKLGNGIVLVEYITEVQKNSTRPGAFTFRVLPRSWQFQTNTVVLPGFVTSWFTSNYSLVPPIFNEWFEETLTYEADSGQISYEVNGQIYEVQGPKIQTEKVRIYIHGYGFGEGHEVLMDWIEIDVK